MDYESDERAEGAPEPAGGDRKEVAPSRAALVKRWCEKIKASKDHHKDAFKRMRESMQLASEGADAAWIADDNYVVPIVNRHINQAVSTLYARNPKAVAKRKPKLLYQVWDGDPQSLQAAMASVAQAAAMPPSIDPMTGQMVPPAIDPNAMALLEEVQQVKQTMLMYDRMAKTMQLLFAYYLDEQDSGYKEQIKALVRRAKVCGVGYISLGFQRRFKKNPDVMQQIADATDQLARIDALMQSASAGEVEADSAKAEELRLLVADLQSRVDIIAREGPVLGFPKSTEIIVDKRCRHLKTFAGARWIAQEFMLTCDEVYETYQVKLNKADYTPYKDGGDRAESKDDGLACVWAVQDKQNGQTLTVVDGYDDFLVEPAEPDVKIERFWTVFALVFNEVESEKHLYPPSDAWNARHMQKEYNSSRQGLREHRIAARPRYVTPRGAMEEADVKTFGTAPPHTISQINSLKPGEDVSKFIQRWPVVPVDQNLYETESVFADVQRSVGSQEANLGGTSGATATETSIAENSRMSASADNVDDLDTMLTQLARAMGQLMLTELTIDTVREIAGPGAVWPEMPPKREEVVKDLFLDVEAGSSGRPNKAAKLADFERAAPYLVQIPGVNPTVFAKKALDLLDIDLEEGIVEGAPSIVAMNQMAGRPAPMTDAPQDQGGQGGDNAPRPGGNEAQAQPAYPAPAQTPSI